MEHARVVLADDHVVVREGLVRLLEPEFDVVGAVGDGRSLVTEVQRLRPDVVVVDIGMPLLNGIEAARQIIESAPETRIIFLTQQTGKEYLQAALACGARGYVLKNAAGAELVQALREVLAGWFFLSPELQMRYPDARIAPTGGRKLPFGGVLTARQREVLQLVAEGKSGKEAAHILGISLKTIEFHKKAIMDALGVRTTAELTRYALEHGILQRSDTEHA